MLDDKFHNYSSPICYRIIVNLPPRTSISTKTYAWMHDKILDFVSADSKEFTCFFMMIVNVYGIVRVFQDFQWVLTDFNEF